MIYSIHIPKTAGTSFRRALEQRYGSRLALYYGPQDPKTTPLLKAATSRDLAARVAELPDRGFEVLHGHYQLKAVLPLIQDPSRQVWTWLRDPVDRVMSQYDFFKERALELDPLAKKVKSGEVEFGKFERVRGVREVQTRYLAGGSISEFAFVGITERFELGLELLFGADAPRLPMRYNATLEKREVTYEDRARIAALNSRDMMLYAEALQLFMDRALGAVGAPEAAAPPAPAPAPRSLIKRLIGKAG